MQRKSPKPIDHHAHPLAEAARACSTSRRWNESRAANDFFSFWGNLDLSVQKGAAKVRHDGTTDIRACFDFVYGMGTKRGQRAQRSRTSQANSRDEGRD